MNRVMSLFVFVLLGAQAWALQAVFPYQAELTDAEGNAYAQNTSLNLSFALLDASGSELWHSATQAVTVGVDGVVRFMVYEEDNVAPSYADVVMQNDSLTLQMYKDGDAFGPKQKLLPAPFAVHAQVAEGAEGDFTVDGAFVVTGASNSLTVAQAEVATFQAGGAIAVSGKVTADSLVVATPESSFLGQLPVGAVVPWVSGTELPDGWAVCDGSSGTMDLDGLFIRGAQDGETIGATGGEAQHTLTLLEMPSHGHTFTFYTPKNMTGKPDGYKDHGSKWNYNYWYGEARSISSESGAVGGGQAHENRPPFYTLIYIQRIR